MNTRKSIRLENYDYASTGCYFITICTKDRKPMFWDVGAGSPRPRLSTIGKMVKRWILRIPEKYPTVHIDKYVIMPNHIHLLISLEHNNGRGDPAPTINTVMGWLKYQITVEINRYHNTIGTKIFQRSFYDHIIRDEQDYLTKWNYIETNPYRWSDDEYFLED